MTGWTIYAANWSDIVPGQIVSSLRMLRSCVSATAVETAYLRSSNVGVCYFCGQPTEEDFYCFGCEEYICTECDHNYGCSGRHTPECHEGTDEDYEREE